MPESGENQKHIEELKASWEDDPSSKVYLDLAEEYRVLGQFADAVKVLEISLMHRPRDPRGHFALGRCRLEMGDIEDAIKLLEGVVKLDPEHAQASKLLLEGHLQLGEADKANERLKIYRLLNDRDPELDHLEYRLGRLLSGASEDAGEPALEAAALVELPIEEPVIELPRFGSEAAPQAAAEPSLPAMTPFPEALPAAPASDAGRDFGSDDIFGLSEPLPEPPSLFDLWQDPEPAQALPEATPEPTLAAASPADSDEPFAALLAQQPAEPSPGSSEDLFDLVAGSSADTTADDAAQGAADAAQGAAEAALVADGTASEVADEVADLMTDAGVPAVSDLVTGDVAEQPAPLVGESGEDLEPEASALQEIILETSDDTPTQVLEALDDEVSPTEASAQEPQGTATLAGIYLAQGHTAEAKRIFSEILDKNPDSLAAREGLAKVAAAEADAVEADAPAADDAREEISTTADATASKAISAASLLADKALVGTVPDELAEKKILLLELYIQHLRNASQPHVQ